MTGTKLVILQRQPGVGFGFNVICRKGRPLTICMVLQGGPAKESGQVEVGDIVLSIDGKDASKMLTSEAISYIKSCGERIEMKLVPNSSVLSDDGVLSTSSIISSERIENPDSHVTCDSSFQTFTADESLATARSTLLVDEQDNNTSSNRIVTDSKRKKLSIYDENHAVCELNKEAAIRNSTELNNYNIDNNNTIDWPMDCLEEIDSVMYSRETLDEISDKIKLVHINESGPLNPVKEISSVNISRKVAMENENTCYTRAEVVLRNKEIDSQPVCESNGAENKPTANDDDTVWTKTNITKRMTSSSSCSSLKGRTIVRRSLRSSMTNHVKEGCSSHVADAALSSKLNFALDTTKQRQTATDVARSDQSSKPRVSILKNALDDVTINGFANKMYKLDGYKISDIAGKINGKSEYSRKLGTAYLKLFDFKGKRIDDSLRYLLKKMTITGETQDRERVLQHFSFRYFECNPGEFASEDDVHTLACALMLLNSDLHGENVGKRMTADEFINNLTNQNIGCKFAKENLKELYTSIRENKLEWALGEDNIAQVLGMETPSTERNPNLAAEGITYKDGPIRYKRDENEEGKKRSKLQGRKWKAGYITLQGATLFIGKDSHTAGIGFKGSESISILHAYAINCSNYKNRKREHVLKLTAANRRTYLFQTEGESEKEQWLKALNTIAARYSSPPLLGGVGNSKKFVRPVLPMMLTKYDAAQQLECFRKMKLMLERQFQELEATPPLDKAQQTYRDEKQIYLRYEMDRLRAYIFYLMNKDQDLNPLLAKILQEKFTKPSSVL